MREIWKKVKKYDRIEVSNFGGCRWVNNKSKVPVVVRKGYNIACFKDEQKNNKQLRIAKEVMAAFSDEEHIKVRHKDGAAANDEYSNLEWVTRINAKEKYRRRKIIKEKDKSENIARWHARQMSYNAKTRINNKNRNNGNSYKNKITPFGFNNPKELENYIYDNFKQDITKLLKDNKYPSIDRINSGKGYCKGNIQVISFYENVMRGVANHSFKVDIVENDGTERNFKSLTECGKYYGFSSGYKVVRKWANGKGMKPIQIKHVNIHPQGK